jgi:tetratricopeptide (TPR) repeat protein
MFPNIAAGEYDIEVSSAGYKTSREQVSVFSGASNYTVYVYMHPESEAVVVRGAAPGKPVMSPRLQSEVDKAFDKMRRGEFDSARTHLEKAAKMAPGNPDVQYLLGILEYTQQHYDVARTKFETAISLFPKHERALVALGELLLRAGQAGRAAESLEKAYLIDGADWRMHFLLAYAYATQKQYEKARPHAERASELGRERGVPARLLLAQILVAEGEANEAKTQFNAILRDVPNDSAAAVAKAELAKFEKPAMVAATGKAESAATSLPSPAITWAPELPVVVRHWAPPDVDAKEYVVAPDVTCSVGELLQRTQMRTAKHLANFERFMATEHIEHQQLDASGNAGPVKTRDFTYLVFIQRPKKGPLFLEEERDGGENLDYFPTTLATRGLVGLGVFLFDPTYEGDVQYKCEGLGAWRGQPAWQVRFEQRKEVVSRLMRWTNRHGTFPVPLKGRVWIAANTYDVLHLETDLREPVRQIELSRDHRAIDYGPVQFEHGGTSLWLPWYAELYMELRGKRYHHRHTLTNYKLFSVDTTHVVSAPKAIR